MTVIQLTRGTVVDKIGYSAGATLAVDAKTAETLVARGRAELVELPIVANPSPVKRKRK